MTIHLLKEIEKLKRNILALSSLVEETVQRVIKALNEYDAVTARVIMDTDVLIDEREVEIEEECQKVLALHQPVAHDLRFIIAVLKINAELERIGDATVNIAERVLFLASQERAEHAFDYTTMAEKAQQMLRMSLAALINLDVNIAYDVLAADDEVDTLNREAYNRFEECVRNDPVRVSVYTHLLGVSRHIERIADHATNIAEDVIYLIEGKIVRHRAEEFRQAQS